MWRRRDLARLRQCDRRDRSLLAEAALWLGVARIAILTLPFRWTVRLFALSHGDAAAVSSAEAGGPAARVGWAVRAVAPRTPWKSACLAQALAGAAMLRTRGIPSTMTLGVARPEDRSAVMQAHAWLCCGETILTGAAGHERFHVIARFEHRAV